MFWISLIFSLYASDVIKVAVIDSGLEKTHSIPLCDNQTKLSDANGHGTNISHAIHNQITNKTKYCQVIYKVIDDKYVIFKPYIDALKKISERKDIHIINISLSGKIYSAQEDYYIKKIVKQGKFVVVAAGNQGLNLSKKCNVYPSCITEPKMIVVGNIDKESKIDSQSNYGGPVHMYEIGKFCYKGECMSGTSQSAAILTGKLTNILIKRGVNK